MEPTSPTRARCAVGVGLRLVHVAVGDELVEQPGPLGAQLGGTAEAAVTADDDERVDATLDEVADGSPQAVTRSERRAAGGSEHRSTLVEDAADVGRRHRTDRCPRHRPGPATPRTRRTPQDRRRAQFALTARTAAFIPAESPPLVRTASLVGTGASWGADARGVELARIRATQRPQCLRQAVGDPRVAVFGRSSEVAGRSGRSRMTWLSAKRPIVGRDLRPCRASRPS